MQVTLPGPAAEILYRSPLKKEHPQTWRNYLNHSLAVHKSGHITVKVDLSEDDLKAIMQTLTEMDLMEGVPHYNLRSAVGIISQCLRDGQS